MNAESARSGRISGNQRFACRKVTRRIGVAIAVIASALAVRPCFAQQMDPVRGRLELQAPGPYFEGSKGGGTYGYSIKSDFGRVKSWTFTDGETLKGRCSWGTASSADVQTPAAPDGTPPPRRPLEKELNSSRPIGAIFFCLEIL